MTFLVLVVAGGLALHFLGKIAIPGYRAVSDRLGIRRVFALGVLLFVLVGIGKGMASQSDASGMISYMIMFAVIAAVSWLAVRSWWRQPSRSKK